MTWFGGIALGLGALLVGALIAYRILQVARRRVGSREKEASYADRLEVDSEVPVPDDLDHAADDLIREHGADAVIEAAERMLATLDERDLRARAVWRKVLDSAEASRRREDRQHEAAE